MEAPFPDRPLSPTVVPLMVDVANLSDSADKFERRAGQAGQDYETGVSSVSDSEQQQATLLRIPWSP